MKYFICAFSVIGLAFIEVIYCNSVSFSLDNLGFSTSGEDLANVNMEPTSQPSCELHPRRLLRGILLVRAALSAMGG